MLIWDLLLGGYLTAYKLLYYKSASSSEQQIHGKLVMLTSDSLLHYLTIINSIVLVSGLIDLYFDLCAPSAVTKFIRIRQIIRYAINIFKMKAR